LDKNKQGGIMVKQNDRELERGMIFKFEYLEDDVDSSECALCQIDRFEFMLITIDDDYNRFSDEKFTYENTVQDIIDTFPRYKVTLMEG